jgi:hypothetical protein
MFRWLIKGSPPAARLPRDARIDALRGLALVAIFINHVPANPLSQFTFAAFGFSDAAEIFVFLAGYATALAFLGSWTTGAYAVAGARLVARAGKLYTSHLLVFVLVAAMVGYASQRSANPLYFEVVNLTPFFTAPASALAGAVTLTYQPFFMDILPLYIVLLAGFPAVAWLMWRRPIAVLLASAGLYVGSVTLGLNLPNGPGVWFFNPFAWQFLFLLGALAAAAASSGVTLANSRVVAGAAGLYLLFAFLAASSWSPLDPARLSEAIGVDFLTDVSKTDLSAWRLLNVLAFLYLAAFSVRSGASWLDSRPVQTVAAMGRHSLPVFCVGIVLSVAAHVLLLEYGVSAALHATINLGGVLALLFTGLAMEWYGRLTNNKGPRTPRGEVRVAKA